VNSRPLSITIISWLFIAVGGVGLLYHLSEFKSHSPFDYDLVAIPLIRLVAILAGVFLLRGSNWARWLLIAWMTYHIGLSAFHSLSEFLMHVLIFGTVMYFLFRSQSSAYFRKPSSVVPELPGTDEKPVS
jgi:hypothetical protein